MEGKRIMPAVHAFARWGLIGHYIHQMASCVQHYANVLPKDVTADIPGYACLLGNLLEISRTALSQPDCSSELAVDLASVTTFLLELLPSMKSPRRDIKESAALGDDDVVVSDQEIELALNKDVEKQICDAIDPRFLLQLANALFGQISRVSGPYDGPDDKEVKAVGTACAFLHVTFNTLPLEQIMTVLAYRTELVPVLWSFIKKCHENQKWSSFSEKLAYLSGDAPGWLLPLAVFCPVYKHMLIIIDNEEFYEKEKPLSLKDIRCLIVILRQALWQLLWVSPTAPSNSAKHAASGHANKRHTVDFIQYRVTIVASELLSQLFADMSARDLPGRKSFLPAHYEGDISELGLYFVIINNEYGKQTEEELLPGGRNRRVTCENVITFIHLVANHRLNFQHSLSLIRQQSSHFLRGFQQLIQKEWIDMFNEHEFQLSISGSLDSLDVDDLRTHTTYSSGYHREHYVIEMFWEVIKSFSVENQKKFLKFVTGCSRGPLLVFSFCFRAAGNANEEALDRLPTSATCMNLLKLPPYRSKEQLANKFLYAINADAGFDLS
uniref:HECT-type E3 ubiquitin transferase n=1 Tax=Cucumis sativus TaxID=3659 RepID=A0A0A0K808_CUCSA